MSAEIVIVEDRKGRGAAAADESRVTIRYVMRHAGETVASSDDLGQLVFEIGMGEVILGLEQAVLGMQVGGHRRVTVPAPLAYGDRGAPGVPAGATLEIEIELVAIA